MLYVYDKENGEIIVPEEFLDIQLFTDNKRELRARLGLKDEKGHPIPYGKLEVRLKDCGYTIEKEAPSFGAYLHHFIQTYKSKQSALTMMNRKRVVERHIAPRFGSVPIDAIGTADVQIWFDELCEQGYSRETILKIKHTINPVFDSAVEDGLIRRNPLQSKRLTINTHKEGHHKAIPSEKMKEVRENIGLLPLRERRIVALLSYTGMRLEEALGLRWEDINLEEQEISIRRAVVHPQRNQPVVKSPKTVSSARIVPLARQLALLLMPLESEGFVLGGETPLTYQQQKRSFEKIRKTFGLEDFSAHDFRDTCATEWQENGMSLESISRLLGHANTTVTEKMLCEIPQKGAVRRPRRDGANRR